VKVYVIWDPLYEEVKSAHATEKSCRDECSRLDDMPGPTGQSSRNEDRCYHHEYGKYELKE